MVEVDTRSDLLSQAFQEILEAVPLLDRIDVTAALHVQQRRHRFELHRELTALSGGRRARRAANLVRDAADTVAALLLFRRLAEPWAGLHDELWAILLRRVVLMLRRLVLQAARHRAEAPPWLRLLCRRPEGFVAVYAATLLDPVGISGFTYHNLGQATAWFVRHCRCDLDQRAAEFWPEAFALSPLLTIDRQREHAVSRVLAAGWTHLVLLFDGRTGCAIRFWLLLHLRLTHRLASEDGLHTLTWQQAARALRQLRDRGPEAMPQLDVDDLPPDVTWSDVHQALADDNCDASELREFWEHASSRLTVEQA